MRRVLFFHYGGGIGGAPVSMLQTAAALDSRVYSPKVVFSHSGPILEYAAELGVPAEVVGMDSGFFYSTLAPFRFRQFWRFLRHFRASANVAEELCRRESPDIVHFNTSVLVPAAIGVKRVGIPIVWHVREPVGPNPLLRRYLTGTVASIADHVIATSAAVARGYKGRVPVTVIHNALDGRRFHPMEEGVQAAAREELGIPPDAPVVGIVGAVQPIKGHFFLADSAPLLLNEVPDVRFLVVAGGVDAVYGQSVRGRVKRLVGRPLDHLDRLQRRVRELGLESRFVYSGFRSDIPRVISAMDVLAFPSLVVEGFGRPLIESMAMQCPVVATDIGPTREVVGDGVAALVPPGDVRALASALARVLLDRRLATTMARAGRRRFLDAFEMSRLQEQLTQVYDSVLEGRSATPGGPRPTLEQGA